MVALRTGSATWVNSSRASLNYGQVARMQVQSLTRYGYVRFPLGSLFRPGVMIHSATLQLTQIGTWTAAVTAQRVASQWKRGTITWGSKPDVTGTAVTATRTGDLLEFAVGADVQTMVDTGANYGWRISSGVVTAREIKGFEAASGTPVLVVVYSYPPAAPTDPNPSGDSVSLTKPVLQYHADDSIAQQVQVAPVGTTWDPVTGFVSPTLDSGVVATTAHEYDLAASTYGGLTSGSTSWTVRVQSAAGVWSNYMTPATFSRTAKPAMTFVQPGASVWESSPPFDVDMVGMTAVRFFVAKDADPTRVLYDSGVIPSTTGQHTPTRPAMLDNGALYRVTAWGWDNVPRETTPGDPPYVVASRTTTLTTDATVTGVSNLEVTQPGPEPKVTGTFTRATPPDTFTIRNATTGAVVYDQVPYTTLLTSGTAYAFTDWAARPNVANTYQVQAVVNGKSSAAATFTVTPRVASRWVIDLETGTAVIIHGKGIEWAQPESAAIHELEDGTVVRRRFRRGRPEGSVEGLLIAAPAFPGYVAETMAAQLLAWADGPSSKVFRLVTRSLSLNVTLGDINVPPSDLSSAADPAYDVTLSYWAAP